MTYSKRDKLTKNQLNLSYETSKEDYALIRDFFLNQNTDVIQQILESDLKYYMDGYDIKRIKFITTDFFIPAFLEKICNVYDNPPLFKSTEEIPEQFYDLIDEVDLMPFMNDTFKKMKFHNTTLANIKYNARLDKIILENHYNVSNTCIYTYEDYEGEFSVLAYRYKIVDGDSFFVVWDRDLKEHYIVVTNQDKPEFNADAESLRLDGEHYLIQGNEDYNAPDYGVPFITYRYAFDGMDFWGNGMDSIVELIRTINILLTVMADDTVQESIRLLILNFNPTGTTGESGQLKAGLRHPLFVEDRLGNTASPSGQIVSADLYNEEILKLVENLTDMVSSLHNVDNVLKQNVTQSLSGISLRLKTEPLLRQWANDINKVRKNDIALIKKLVEVNNYHRKDNQIPTAFLDSLTLDYQEPKIVTDEKDDYALEKAKWDDGVSSPVQYLMKKNPELNEDEVKELILKNLNDTSEMITTGNAFQIEPVELENEINE